MFKVISSSLKRRHLFKFYNSYFQEISDKRTFLSQTYNCLEEWNRRFETPIIQNLDLDLLYHSVNNRFNVTKNMSSIDIDCIVNGTKNEDYFERLQDLVHKFRLTKNTQEMLPSTPHTLIRLLLQHEKIKDLLIIFNDRLNYGIFPDDYCSNLLMDYFIVKKDFVGAAQIGILQMLQEEWTHPLTTQMSLYSCYHYLKNPLPWTEDEDEVPKDTKEEIKIRVDFIRNPFFDDHFDLTDPKLLTGKALAWGGKTLENVIGNTYQAIGWCYYQKWTELTKFLNYLKKSPDHKIYKQAITMITEYFETSKDESLEETKTKILSLLKSLESNNIENEDFEKIIEAELIKTVSENEEDLINTQKKFYLDWNVNREKVLNEHLENSRKEQRLKEIEKEKKELKEREDVLYFFENEEKWDLIIDKKRVYYPKRYFGVKKQKKNLAEENYIPPEV